MYGRPPVTHETVGERIRRLRLERGLSQRDLAAGLEHCSYAYLSRIEAGTRNPSVRALEQVARKLGTTVLYLEAGGEDGVCPYCLRDAVLDGKR